MVKVVIMMMLSKKQDKSKTKEKKNDIKRTLLIVSVMALILLSLFLFFVVVAYPNQLVSGIISAASAVLIPILLYVLDRHDIKKVANGSNDYNNKLNQLRDSLVELEYNNNGIKENWYSKGKIQHLIKECDEILKERSTPIDKSIEFVKIMILPIISFIAGVISKNTDVEISLQFAVIALVIVVSIWGLNQVIEFLDEIVLKSSSVSTIKNVKNMLSDLLARDFGNE